MANIKIIKGSELPIVEDINKSTFLAYEDKTISLKSGRIDLSKLTPLFGVTSEKGQSITVAPSQKLFTEEIDKKADEKTDKGFVVRTADGTIPETVISGMINVSQQSENYDLDLESAIKLIPKDRKKIGSIIRFSVGGQNQNKIVDLTPYIHKNTNLAESSGLTRPDPGVDFMLWYPVEYGKTYIFYTPSQWQPLIREYETVGGAMLNNFWDSQYTTKFSYTIKQVTTKYITICTRMKYGAYNFNISDYFVHLLDGIIPDYNSKIETKTFHYIGNSLSKFDDSSYWKEYTTVGYKNLGSTSKTTNLTTLSKQYLKLKTGINQNTGDSQSWSSSDSIIDLPIDTNADTVIDGSLSGGIFVRNAQKELTRTLVGAPTVKFTTTSDECFVSFYVRLQRGFENDFDSVNSYSISQTKLLTEYALDINNELFPISDFGNSTQKTEKIKLKNIPFPQTLCKVSLTGSMDGMSKDAAKRMTFKAEFDSGRVLNLYADVRHQGLTSLNFVKKNFSIDLLDEDAEPVSIRIGTWVSCDSYHLKANYIDAMHSRNIGCARLYEQIVMTRDISERRPWSKYNDFEDVRKLYDTGALGHIDGFACELYINGEYHGLYTFNLKKARSNYNMKKKDVKNIHLEMADNPAYIQSNIDWSKWVIRNPKGFTEKVEPENGDVKTSIKAFFNWASSLTTSSTKESFEEHLCIPTTIDYHLFNVVTDNIDGIIKNSQVVTLDGEHWSFLPYDLDTVLGLWWDGSSIKRNPTAITTEQPLISKFVSVYAKEINARYQYLRDNKIIDANNITKIFNDFSLTIGIDAYKKDQKKWPEIPSASFLSIYQIHSWIAQRITFLDKKYEYNN